MALRIGMQSRERAKLCLSTQEDQARDVNIAGTNLLVTYHTINQNQAKKKYEVQWKTFCLSHLLFGNVIPNIF